jgi:hypothetical protein
MSYTTISQCVNDAAFNSRVNACIAQEQVAKGEDAQPGNLIGPVGWAVASANDVESAYASALAANNPNPGGDESVISDEMILSHVQGNWPPAVP